MSYDNTGSGLQQAKKTARSLNELQTGKKGNFQAVPSDDSFKIINLPPESFQPFLHFMDFVRQKSCILFLQENAPLLQIMKDFEEDFVRRSWKFSFNPHLILDIP
jgi:hypothetical protein